MSFLSQTYTLQRQPRVIAAAISQWCQPHDVCFNATADVSCLQRGKVPIVVGGTGFYLRWFMQGKAQGPRTTPEAAAAVKAALKQVLLQQQTHIQG
jgi:hypothetical protein